MYGVERQKKRKGRMYNIETMKSKDQTAKHKSQEKDKNKNIDGRNKAQ
jgi:hypothetical protein